MKTFTEEINNAMKDNVTDISFDLETLGTEIGSPIVAIGVAGFCRKTGKVYKLLEANISLDSAIKHSTGVNPDTLQWWFEQDAEAIKKTFNADEKVSLKWALYQVEHVLKMLSDQLTKPVHVWGNGATFDISLLEYAFSSVHIRVPWKFWNVRDVRTVVDLGRDICGIDPKKDFPFQGTRHSALDDAVHQASYTAAIISALAYKKQPQL